MATGETITPEKLVALFNGLPNDKEFRFEEKLTNLVKTYDGDDLKSQLCAVLAGQSESTHRYAAFFSLAIMYRYLKDFDAMNALIETHTEFNNRASYLHLELLYRLSSNNALTPNDIKDADENRRKLRNNAGADHLLADITATFYETHPSKNNSAEQNLQNALDAVDSAISLNGDYAKYHGTKSRLLFLLGNHEDSLSEIDRAIRMESPKSSNFMVNMYTYQNQKMKIIVEMRKEELTQKQIEMQREIDKVNDSQIKNIEFLCFFSGILALLLGGLQIAVSQPFKDSVKLIAVLTGALLFLFAGFIVMLNGFEGKKVLSALAVLLFGALLLGGVLVFL